MRLIDADALKRKSVPLLFPTKMEPCGHIPVPVNSVVVAEIEQAPTIDAVPVVRCRECEHWKPSGSKAGNTFSDMEYIGGCEFTNYYRRESDFCSYGERKEGAERE